MFTIPSDSDIFSDLAIQKKWGNKVRVVLFLKRSSYASAQGLWFRLAAEQLETNRIFDESDWDQEEKG